MPSSTCIKCHRLTPLGVTHCDRCKPLPKPAKPKPSRRLRGYDAEYDRNRVITLSISTLCVLCGKPGSNSADHIVPKVVRLDNSLGNLAPAHLSCNSGRRERPYTDAQAKRVAIYQLLLAAYQRAIGTPA